MADTWTTWETRLVTIREQERYRVRQARYVCPSCQGIAILLEPTDAILSAAVGHRRGAPLPSRRDQTRAAIAQAIERVDVLPAVKGQCTYDPSRLRVTWPDGTTARGVPLDRRSPIPAPELGPIKNQRERIAAWDAWSAEALAAIYDRAGSILAGVRIEAPHTRQRLAWRAEQEAAAAASSEPVRIGA